jgi:uncharacterized protein YqkB
MEVCQLKITITESAAEELNKKIGEQKGYVKIQYVTDGLACGAGVPTLWFVASIDDTEDLLFDTNNRPVLLEKAQLINFDEELKIDYSDSVNSFQLKSPQQIINGRMSFISKVK